MLRLRLSRLPDIRIDFNPEHRELLFVRRHLANIPLELGTLSKSRNLWTGSVPLGSEEVPSNTANKKDTISPFQTKVC